jgi:hypothetical protein
MRAPTQLLSALAIMTALGLQSARSHAEEPLEANQSQNHSEGKSALTNETNSVSQLSDGPGRNKHDGYQYVRQQLDTFVDLDYDGKPFVVLVSELAKLLRVDIVVDGIDGKCSGIPIHLHLDHCRAKVALKQALQQVDGDLAFVVRDGYLLLSTREKIDALHEVRVYPESRLPRISTHGLPAGGYPGPSSAEQVRHDEFRQLFTVVEPLSWETNGGQGRLAHVNGNVIVWQSPRVHDQIADLLDQLQAADTADLPVAKKLPTVTAPPSLPTSPALPVPAAPSSLLPN